MKMRKIMGIVLIVCALLVTGCSQNEIKNQVKWPIQKFTFTNQDGKQFGSSDLKGKVWIADFVFTTCKDICPPMTFNMSSLQKKLKEQGMGDVQLVSFSVDPTVDTPNVMKKYASQYKADLKNWNFLTGYSQGKIENFALKNFKALVKKPDQSEEVIHGTDFYLIDKEGAVRKTYSGYEKVPYTEILHDIKALQ